MNRRPKASHFLMDGVDGSDQTLRLHRVLNDYQAIIAFIIGERTQAAEPAVKEALQRVADHVYDLASTLRHPNG